MFIHQTFDGDFAYFSRRFLQVYSKEQLVSNDSQRFFILHSHWLSDKIQFRFNEFANFGGAKTCSFHHMKSFRNVTRGEKILTMLCTVCVSKHLGAMRGETSNGGIWASVCIHQLCPVSCKINGTLPIWECIMVDSSKVGNKFDSIFK